MREPLISINDIPQVGTVTVDLMGVATEPYWDTWQTYVRSSS